MLNELSKQIHENAKAKGFYDGEKNVGEILCLIHSEVSEALEADMRNRYTNRNSNPIESVDFNTFFVENVKNTFEDEMADIIIRTLDLCAYKGIDIHWHIRAKMRYNAGRENLHGKLY